MLYNSYYTTFKMRIIIHHLHLNVGISTYLYKIINTFLVRFQFINKNRKLILRLEFYQQP